MVQKWYFDGVLLFVYPGTVAVVNDVVIVSIVFVVTVTVFTTNDGVPIKKNTITVQTYLECF